MKIFDTIGQCDHSQEAYEYIASKYGTTVEKVKHLANLQLLLNNFFTSYIEDEYTNEELSVAEGHSDLERLCWLSFLSGTKYGRSLNDKRTSD